MMASNMIIDGSQRSSPHKLEILVFFKLSDFFNFRLNLTLQEISFFTSHGKNTKILISHF